MSAVAAECIVEVFGGVGPCLVLFRCFGVVNVLLRCLGTYT